jgi:ABC-type multidrug transport system ATPase subunit
MIFKCVSKIDLSYQPGICLLKLDNWNDYRYRTLFDLYIVPQNGNPRLIGPVKIIRRGMYFEVDIPEEFETLGSEYCSLGESQAYYEELMELPETTKNDILIALSDCVYNPNIFKEFENENAMRVSLLRFVSRERIERNFKAILQGNSILTPYRFQFLLEENQNVVLDIDVKPHSTPPTNVHVLIGRNGVGKTRLLSGIINSLTKTSNNIGIKGKLEFLKPDNSNCSFANLVLIAFSAFDSVFQASHDSTSQAPHDSTSQELEIRYKYIGLIKEKGQGVKSLDDLNQDFTQAIQSCMSDKRKKRWLKAVETLSSDQCFAEMQRHCSEGNIFEEISDRFKNLSSGHKIVLLSITKLVELVDENTFVIIDEPENHLHPPLLSSFIRALSDLLIQRNGVALLATHSPVVLQEIPRSCVSIMRRSGDRILIDKPLLETFGENVGTLTREVFRLEVTESGFHNLLSKLISEQSYEEALESLNGELGLEGQAIMRVMDINKNK